MSRNYVIIWITDVDTMVVYGCLVTGQKYHDCGFSLRPIRYSPALSVTYSVPAAAVAACGAIYVLCLYLYMKMPKTSPWNISETQNNTSFLFTWDTADFCGTDMRRIRTSGNCQDRCKETEASVSDDVAGSLFLARTNMQQSRKRKKS